MFIDSVSVSHIDMSCGLVYRYKVNAAGQGRYAVRHIYPLKYPLNYGISRLCVLLLLLILLSYIIVSYCQLSLLEPCSGQWPNFEEASFGWWSSGHAAALSGSPHFFMDALYRSTPVRSLFSTQIFSLDAFSWVRYSGGPDASHSWFKAAAIHASFDRSSGMTLSIFWASPAVVRLAGLESAWRHFILSHVVQDVPVVFHCFPCQGEDGFFPPLCRQGLSLLRQGAVTQVLAWDNQIWSAEICWWRLCVNLCYLQHEAESHAHPVRNLVQMLLFYYFYSNNIQGDDTLTFYEFAQKVNV